MQHWLCDRWALSGVAMYTHVAMLSMCTFKKKKKLLLALGRDVPICADSCSTKNYSIGLQINEDFRCIPLNSALVIGQAICIVYEGEKL